MTVRTFPYRGGLDNNTRDVFSFVRQATTGRKIDRFIDPTAGSSTLAWLFACENVPVHLNDLCAFAWLNASSLFCLDSGSWSPFKSQIGRLTKSRFGFWNDEVRQLIDGIMISVPSVIIRAATIRAIMECSFRNTSWAETFADGRRIYDLDTRWFASRIAHFSNLIEKRRVPLKGSTVSRDDLFRFMTDQRGQMSKGDLVFLDLPWPWPIEHLSVGAYDFYKPLDEIILQEPSHDDLSWGETIAERQVAAERMWEMTKSAIRHVLATGALVLLIKQSFAYPQITNGDLPGRCLDQVKLPVRGRKMAKKLPPEYHETFWLLADD